MCFAKKIEFFRQKIILRTYKFNVITRNSSVQIDFDTIFEVVYPKLLFWLFSIKILFLRAPFFFFLISIPHWETLLKTKYSIASL